MRRDRRNCATCAWMRLMSVDQWRCSCMNAASPWVWREVNIEATPQMTCGEWTMKEGLGWNETGWNRGKA